MTERPIIFSGEMVRAILDGRKTQTRRVINPQPAAANDILDDGDGREPRIFYAGHGQGGGRGARDRIAWCPYGRPGERVGGGDRLYIKEPLVKGSRDTGGDTLMYARYRIDGELADPPVLWMWATERLAGRFMPKAAARHWLEVTDVRVQRVQDIGDGDARKEGMLHYSLDINPTRREQFTVLWDSLNAKRGYGWDANPWVWAVTFRPMQG